MYSTVSDQFIESRNSDNSTDDYSRILNFLLYKLIRSGNEFNEVRRISSNFKLTYFKILESGEKPEMHLDQKSINRRFSSNVEFYDSYIYSCLLADNFVRTLETRAELTKEEDELKILFAINLYERDSYANYIK